MTLFSDWPVLTGSLLNPLLHMDVWRWVAGSGWLVPMAMTVDAHKINKKKVYNEIYEYRKFLDSWKKSIVILKKVKMHVKKTKNKIIKK